jgi:hypothetical protein
MKTQRKNLVAAVPRRSGPKASSRAKAAKRRKKISTTIAPEGYAFLERLIASGKAANLAGAIDLVLEESRRADNRARLERATAAYYDSLTPEEVEEENQLGAAISASNVMDLDE